MVSKMDSCMVDLVDYHQKAVEHQEAAAQSMTPGVAAPTAVPEAEDATNDAASNVSYESAGSLPDNAENSAGSSQTPERQYSRPLVIYESKPEQGAGILAAIRRSLRWESTSQCILELDLSLLHSILHESSAPEVQGPAEFSCES